MERMKLQTNIIKFFKNIDYQRIANNATYILEHIKLQAFNNSSLKFEIMAKQLYVASQRVL